MLSATGFMPLLLCAFTAIPAAETQAGTSALDEARTRLQAGDSAGALARLEPLREDPATPPEALALLGALYLQAGRPGEALAVLEPLASTSADPVLLFSAGRAALALGERSKGEAFLQRSVSRAPVSPAALLLADLRAQEGRNAEVVELLRPMAEGETSAALEREEPALALEALRRYARALLAGGDPGRAVDALERASRLAPNEVELWQLLGDTLIELGRVDEARDAFAALHRLKEERRAKDAEAQAGADEEAATVAELVLAARAHQQAGRNEQALDALRRAMVLAPRDPWPRVLEIRLLIGLHREREALPKTETLVRIAPDHPEGYYLRGMARLAMQDLVAAETDLRHVLELDPRHLAGLNGLAILLISRSDYKEAEAVLERLLTYWPGDELATRNLERVRQQVPVD